MKRLLIVFQTTLLINIFCFLQAGYSQEIGEKTLFFKEYFSQYPYRAILLSRPKSLVPGTIMLAETLESYLAPSECFEIKKMSDFSPFVATLTQLSLSASSWFVNLEVKLSGYNLFNSSANVRIKRSVSLAENNIMIVKQVLRPSVKQLFGMVKKSCNSQLEAATLNRQGNLFLIDQLFTFSGELRTSNQLEIDMDAGVSVSLKDFMSKAREVPFVNSILKQMNFEASASLSSGIVKGNETIQRFPIASDKQVYDFMAFVPLFVSRDAIDLIKLRYSEDQAAIQGVLNGEQDAPSFLKKFPFYSLENPKGAIRLLFKGTNPVRYSAYTTENEDNEFSSQISEIYLVNALRAVQR